MKNFYFTLALFAISVFSFAQAPVAQITIETPALICNPNECSLLTASPTALKATTNYVVNSIPYNPTFPYTGGVVLPIINDDNWSPSLTLPFSFSFYGNCYNTVLIGTNGVVTFDLVNQSPGGFCAWNINQSIPSTTFPIKNAIYGVYQDTDINSPPITNPAIQNINYNVFGIAPNRALVINFNQLPQYQCNASVGLQTSQIVIYETTNIIDINVENRSACNTWNTGSGIIGLQNQMGNLAITPAARNRGNWTATNEAWRFAPNGAEMPVTFEWYADETLIAGEETNTFLACPNENTSYRAAMTFMNCDNTEIVLSSNTVNEFLVPEPSFGTVEDISVCTESPFVYNVDLTSNTDIALSLLNPADYEILFYENLSDAQNITFNYIVDANNYNFNVDKTIYMSIVRTDTGCNYIKSFQLTIVPLVAPPTGAGNQDFTAGETLADLEVIGENLVWYDAPTEGNMLPSNTLLQDNTTYYASQIINGCETNRSVNANRFAVTTTLVVLGNEVFTTAAFSVFPNPVNNQLTISSREILKSVSLYNAIGQEILHSTANQKELHLNTTTLNTGVYFLKINTEKESRTVKIIKN